MDDAEQQKLFEDSAGEVSPPEPGLYLGTSGWSYADWEGTLYPAGASPAARLPEYVKHYATVEIDSTFYATPRRTTVERWRGVAPEGFLFAAKFPREISHEKELLDCEDEARIFVRTMQSLGDRLGPLLLQLPPGFSVEGMDALESFLDRLPGGARYAVEVRHRSWVDSELSALLREKRAALVLVDYPRMPRLEAMTADFTYIRWLGDRREFPSGHTGPKKDRTEELSWWSGVVDGALSDNRTVFAYANNHYQNHSPSTLARFLEIRAESWRGEA